MLYEYIKNNYQKGEPIFISELPGSSKNAIRQELKSLTDSGRLERVNNGVYMFPYTTILGTKGKLSVEKYLEKKYLSVEGKVTGYTTGLQLANEYGFTTQNPACYEICTNEATTKQRKVTIDGKQVVIYRPVTTITNENQSAMQFLDLMNNIDRYSEISESEMKNKLQKVVESIGVNFQIVKELLPLYPDKVYRNLYEGGMMNALV